MATTLSEDLYRAILTNLVAMRKNRSYTKMTTSMMYAIKCGRAANIPDETIENDIREYLLDENVNPSDALFALVDMATTYSLDDLGVFDYYYVIYKAQV